jgi:hypothetical protein
MHSCQVPWLPIVLALSYDAPRIPRQQQSQNQHAAVPTKTLVPSAILVNTWLQMVEREYKKEEKMLFATVVDCNRFCNSRWLQTVEDYAQVSPVGTSWVVRIGLIGDLT